VVIQIMTNAVLWRVRTDHAHLSPRMASGARWGGTPNIGVPSVRALRILGGDQRTTVVTVVAVRVMKVAADPVI
jgi:hypothetical protein